MRKNYGMIPTLIAAMAFSILLAGSSSVAATQVMAAEDNSGYAMVKIGRAHV